MDHPAPELVRPWRTATLVASAVAAVELVLLVVAGVFLLGRTLAPHGHGTSKRPAAKHAAKAPATSERPAVAPPKPLRTASATLPRSKTHVVVLNGNGVSGAAAQEAALVQARGYRVTRVANAPRSGYAKTIVMYRPGFAGEARRFARDLNLSLVEPLDGLKPRALPGAQLLVIVGASR